jgi:hypothetical protein
VVVNNYRRSFTITYDNPAISIVPDAPIDIFDDHYCYSFRAGRQMIVRGAGFSPYEDVPLGVYYLGPDSDSFTVAQDPSGQLIPVGRLVESSLVRADAQGEYTFSREIGRSEIPGIYYAVALTNPNVETYGLYGEPGSASLIACYQVE